MVNNRVEENLKIISMRLKNLKKISYDEVVDKLNDKGNTYQIDFYSKHDIIADINYNCCDIIKNNNTSKIERYLLNDSDIESIYTNFMESLKRKKVNPNFQIFLNYQGINQLTCTIGNSILIFPEELTEKLMASSNESSNCEDNIVCVNKDEPISIPRKLLKLN